MNISVKRRETKKTGRGGVLFFLASALMVSLLCLPQEKRMDAPAFYRAEYGVVCGEKEMQGEKRVFSRETLLRGKLMLASPRHPLPEDLPLPDTRSVRAMVGAYLPAETGTLLCAETAYALCEMERECPLEDGVIFTTGTVSYAQQEEIQKNAYGRYARVLPLETALQTARENVPGGRETEHRLGYAVDVTLTGEMRLSEENPLCRNETGRWMRENMARFGFIQRFAPGQRCEGNCENVHLRYVGPVHAAAMEVLDLSLEEYLDFLHVQKGITVMKDGKAWAYVGCVPWAGGSFSLPVPADRQAEVSADNTGYAVFTVME